MGETRMLAVFVFSLVASMLLVSSGNEFLALWVSAGVPIAMYLLLERSRTSPDLLASFSLIVVAVAVMSTPLIASYQMDFSDHSFSDGWDKLNSFSSYLELKNYVEKRFGGSSYYWKTLPMGGDLLADASEEFYRFVVDPYQIIINGGQDQTTGLDFSTTNIQVLGVDEADLVKTDGNYLYVVSNDNVFILLAYPPENARILSNIEVNNPSELYVNRDKLAIIGWNYLKVYDISNRSDPKLERNVSFNEGYYYNSRMIGDYIYLIINSPIYRVYTPWEEEQNNWIKLPQIACNGSIRQIPPTEIYYFDDENAYPSQFVTIMAVNVVNSAEKVHTKTILMNSAQNLFVSLSNLYITYEEFGGKTAIHKISIGGGKIKYVARGEVPGTVLNQFSMDEYQGYFRVATTRSFWGGAPVNNVYVLDGEMRVVGRLENLAQGERIYSVRFIGDRGYMVTYVRVDPLFVLDLSNPSSPRVLGELKIPGYSDYLHPYDETHIIGIGKETTTTEWGSEISLGVKLALFDVSDPENPVEISKYVVGEAYTDSLALRDHRAFLFSKSRSLLAIPIGDWYREDAYVFHISLENGIQLKGTVTHENWEVKRILYVDDALYTVSEGMVKIVDMDDLSELKSVLLPVVRCEWGHYYDDYWWPESALRY